MSQQDLNQIQKIFKAELKNFATKEDLKQVPTKADLELFATKEDLEAMEDKIITDLANVIHDVVDSFDKSKADRSDVKKLGKRVDKIEQFFPQQ